MAFVIAANLLLGNGILWYGSEFLEISPRPLSLGYSLTTVIFLLLEFHGTRPSSRPAVKAVRSILYSIPIAFLGAGLAFLEDLMSRSHAGGLPGTEIFVFIKGLVLGFPTLVLPVVIMNMILFGFYKEDW